MYKHICVYKINIVSASVSLKTPETLKKIKNRGY